MSGIIIRKNPNSRKFSIYNKDGHYLFCLTQTELTRLGIELHEVQQ